MNCSLPGSTVHGISQARILEWVAIFFSGDLPDPGITPRSPVPPSWAGRFFTTAPLGKPMVVKDSFYRLGNRGGRDLTKFTQN